MPQIDLVAYLAQYVWTLISLLLLYACVVLKILPRIQQHLALRAQAEVINKDLIVEVGTQPVVLIRGWLLLSLSPTSASSKGTSA